MINRTTSEVDKKLLETNFEKPILEFYNGFFSGCFIILHPFYKRIFSQHFNEFENFNLTYPLIERVSWESILKLTGIKGIKQLALTITYRVNDESHQRMVQSEWNEFKPFLEERHFIEPSWDNDKIPEDVILPFLEYLLSDGYTEIKVGHWPEFSDEKIKLMALTNETKFDDAVKLSNRNFIYTLDGRYCLKLPYHDLPYSFFMTNEVEAGKVSAKLNYEGFDADKRTKMYWYLQT